MGGKGSGTAETKFPLPAEVAPAWWIGTVQEYIAHLETQRDELVEALREIETLQSKRSPNVNRAPSIARAALAKVRSEDDYAQASLDTFGADNPPEDDFLPIGHPTC